MAPVVLVSPAEIYMSGEVMSGASGRPAGKPPPNPELEAKIASSGIRVLVSGKGANESVLLSTGEILALQVGAEFDNPIGPNGPDILMAVEAALERGDRSTVIDLRKSERTAAVYDKVADNFDVSDARAVPVLESGTEALTNVLRQTGHTGKETEAARPRGRRSQG